MKSNYKTTSTISRVNRETNLMRPLTARLDDGYCSITVVNHRLITIIRFVVKSYTHPWKSFTNKLRLVLYALKIFFSRIVRATHAMQPKTKQGRNDWIPHFHTVKGLSALIMLCSSLQVSESHRKFQDHFIGLLCDQSMNVSARCRHTALIGVEGPKLFINISLWIWAAFSAQ